MRFRAHTHIICWLAGCGLVLAACGDRREPVGGPATDADGAIPGADAGTVGPGTDAGTPVTGPCGTLTDLGACDGTVLSWCERGEVQTIDCGTLFPSPATGSCERISDYYGFGCAVQAGDACAYSTTDGDTIMAFCAGTEPGCVFKPEGGTECRNNVGVCVRDLDVGSCTSAGALIIGCQGGGSDPARIQGQPTVAPCTEMGGSCTRNRCVELPDGAQCSEGSALELMCGADLSCADGYCEPDGGVTFRSCGRSTGSGACTNGTDCGIIDGDPEGVAGHALDCTVAGGDIAACVRSRTGLSRGCAACFTDLDAARFERCAGF